jgi:hypothetical protein
VELIPEAVRPARHRRWSLASSVGVTRPGVGQTSVGGMAGNKDGV